MTVNERSGWVKIPDPDLGIDPEYEGENGTMQTADPQPCDATAPSAPPPAEPRSGTPTITPSSGLNAMAPSAPTPPQPRTSPRPPLDTIASASPQPQPVELGLVQIFKNLFCLCFRFCRGGAKRTD